MIYTTCIMFFATFGYNKSTPQQAGLIIFLLSLAAFITIYYHIVQDPTFHQTAYAILTAFVLIRAVWIMEVNIRPSKRRTRDAVRQNGSINGHVNGAVIQAHTPAQKAEDEKALKTLRTMWAMIAYGLTVFLGGFALWNVDNIHCTQLRKWRHDLGLPWGILLEGHGWWHLMTGTGAYFYLVWGIWLRYHLKGQQDDVKLVWPRWFTSVPEIVRVDKGKAKKDL